MTVLDLITGCLIDTGAIGPADPVPFPMAQRAIFHLNRLIDSSNAKKSLIFSTQITLETLTIGKQSYTIGKDPKGILTADFDVPRPVKITQANLLFQTTPNTVRRPMKLLTEDEWAAVRVQQISGPPTRLYCDYAFVNGMATIYFRLVPDQAYQWEMFSWAQNAKIPVGPTALTTQINYPPDYEDYWHYNLMRRLYPMQGKTAPPDVVQFALDAEAALVGLNSPSPRLATEPGLSGGRDGSFGMYNWLDGQVEAE